MLSSVTMLITSIVRIWFLRQARAIRCSRLREPRRPTAGDQQRGRAAEACDLLLPFAFQRRRADHQHARDPMQQAQQFGGGDRLDGSMPSR
jgi:hypothetical protein